ncbi:FkbM family methyltransferase [Halorhabdus sp. CUG00001]|uniref:FkbM family methyltransferase n=1 Tax=Halorhabdus sp. CUG00001 TaxID=2600297 RepID=UPI00131E36A0|nr:FkbM family methyltransferase [Halorhabdus sp. CUG00001]
MSIWSSIKRVFKEEGARVLIKRSAKYLYNNLLRHPYNDRIRRRLPRSDRQREYNQVTVRPYRKFDRIVPIGPPPNRGGHKYPEKYEHALVKALRKWPEEGDSVVVVGGGIGVTSVVAARKVGESGHVTTFEGAKEMAEMTRETAQLNGVDDRVSVEHAIVGSALELAGDAEDATQVPPEELSECDVLEMDCEGAELDILEDIATSPRKIIVETHDNTEAVRSTLVDTLGFEIVSEELAEKGPYADVCERNDIHVIIASR